MKTVYCAFCGFATENGRLVCDACEAPHGRESRQAPEPGIVGQGDVDRARSFVTAWRLVSTVFSHSLEEGDEGAQGEALLALAQMLADERGDPTPWPHLARQAIIVLSDIQRQDASLSARISCVLDEWQDWSNAAVKRTAARLEEVEKRREAREETAPKGGETR